MMLVCVNKPYKVISIVVPIVMLYLLVKLILNLILVVTSHFPLTLAWATIQKVQELTVNEILVDMENTSRFSPGQNVCGN